MTWALFGIVLGTLAVPDDEKSAVKPIDGESDAIRQIDIIGGSPRESISTIIVNLAYPEEDAKAASSVAPVQSSVKPIDGRDRPLGSSIGSKGNNPAPKKRTNIWKKTLPDGSYRTYEITQIDVGISVGKKANTEKVVESVSSWRTLLFNTQNIASNGPNKYQFENIPGREIVRVVVRLSLKNPKLATEVVAPEYLFESFEFRNSFKRKLNVLKTEKPDRKPLD